MGAYEIVVRLSPAGHFTPRLTVLKCKAGHMFSIVPPYPLKMLQGPPTECRINAAACQVLQAHLCSFILYTHLLALGIRAFPKFLCGSHALSSSFWPQQSSLY